MRSLLRAKQFTAAATLTLVLGIGVNLAVFAVVDRALFRPLPFRDIDRLVLASPAAILDRRSSMDPRFQISHPRWSDTSVRPESS